jgi:S1-C subfamily serine protease
VVTPEPPRQFNNEFILGGPTAIESVGVAYDVTATVAAVASGSDAQQAGLKPGDAVTQVEFIAATEEKKELEGKVLHPDMQKPIVLDDNTKNCSPSDMNGTHADTKVN